MWRGGPEEVRDLGYFSTRRVGGFEVILQLFFLEFIVNYACIVVLRSSGWKLLIFI